MDDNENKKPAKSASKGDWTEYALANGKTEADLDGKTRDDIAAMFADEGDAQTATTPKEAVEAANKAGEAMTAEDAPAAVRAGAEDLPPHLRAGAVHRAIKANK